MHKFYFLCVLVAVAVMNTGCFLFSSSGSSSSSSTNSTPPKPTVDYAPQQIRNGSYISFTRPDGAKIKIVFQTNSVADLPECEASDGRINAGYYRYDGFNMSSLKYNYQKNGGYAIQYKAELNFYYETGGYITFLEDGQTAQFTYRP